MVRTPGEIFSFMQSNKIGERVALFWIAWAFVAEKYDNFKLADQIFQKAVKKQAEPKDILQKRYQQFQRRMARHFLNKMEEGNLEEETAVDNRKALHTIAVNNENNPRGQSQNSGRPATSSNPKKSTSVASQGNSQFIAYADPVDQNGTAATLAENKGWKHLAKDSERRKEHDGKHRQFDFALFIIPHPSGIILQARLQNGAKDPSFTAPTALTQIIIPVCEYLLQWCQQLVSLSILNWKDKNHPQNMLRHLQKVQMNAVKESGNS
jgi:hypothetical protein